MTPAISIIIPHLREPENDKALRVALDCIATNTDIDYELLIEAVSTRRNIYPVINRMAERASAEWLVFANSDTFLAPGWASAFYDARDVRKIIGGVIVECGAIPVNERNYERNFGRTPDTFDRAGFEAFIANGDVWREGEIWYFPCLINRDAFLNEGGFDIFSGRFPDDPIDLYFWDSWKASGRTVERVKSYSYHLQNYSTDDPSRIHDRKHRA